LDGVDEKPYTRTKSLLWEVPKENWIALKKIHQPWNIYIDKDNFFLIE